MRHVTEIVSSHYCKHCKDEFIHTWRSKPWFGDYSRNCPSCGRDVGFRGTADFSRDVMEPWERRWETRW